MHITQLHIHNFRNISELKLELHPHSNIFYGANGSGKTSVLEAIYYLGTARSFRSHLASRIVQYDADKFTLFATAQVQPMDDMQFTMGIERPQHGATAIRLMGENVSIAEIAQLMPIQLLHQNSFELLTHGPKYRRKFIDWGMFHVEHQFFPVWKKVKRALEQRNIALKTAQNAAAVAMWDMELTAWSARLHAWRAQYITDLLPLINDLLNQLLGAYKITIKYDAGWNAALSLYDILQRNFLRDQALGFTQFGAHRADLRLLINNIPVQDCLSRGQQKIFLFVMYLAQGLLLQQLTNKSCIYLIDDLAAELDKEKQKMIMRILNSINAQIFATALSHGELRHMTTSNTASTSILT